MQVGLCPSAYLVLCNLIMEFTIVGIDDVTPKGNVSVRMQRNADVETDLGLVLGGRISRIAVRASSLNKEIGDTTELDMDNTFEFEDREWTVPEGEENAGEKRMLEWIVPR